MRRYGSLSMVIAALLSVACDSGGGGGGGPGPSDTGVAEQDTGPRDAGRVDTGRPDTGPVAITAAGRLCTNDMMCGGGDFTCIPLPGGRVCTNGMGCEQGTPQSEAEACGGRGSRGTCLVLGNTSMGQVSICTRSCTPGARTEAAGACPTGTICSTNWLQLTAMQMEDHGCLAFCESDAQCAGVTAGDASLMRCNRRLGRCASAASDNSLRADGLPCNPMMTVPQCRGVCFLLSSTNRTQGLCGSFINTGATTMCPDSPETMDVRAPMGESLGVCIFRNCENNSGCSMGTVCMFPENMGMPVTTAPTFCNFPSARQPNGIPGGATDGGTPTDVTATDTGPAVDAGPRDSGPAATDAGMAADGPRG